MDRFNYILADRTSTTRYTYMYAAVIVFYSYYTTKHAFQRAHDPGNKCVKLFNSSVLSVPVRTYVPGRLNLIDRSLTLACSTLGIEMDRAENRVGACIRTMDQRIDPVLLLYSFTCFVC